VRADDPQLTARPPARPGAAAGETLRQPLKVLADSGLAVAESARLFDGHPVLVAAARIDEAKRARLERHHAQVLPCAGADGRVDLAALLAELARRGINELHVEAGATLAGALLQLGLADELLLYQAPVLVGPGRALADLPRRESLDALRRWQVRDVREIGGDIRVLARAP